MSLSDVFEWFADWADDTSPLYATLSCRIQQDDALLDVAAAAPTEQTAPHLLLAAVHAQLLNGELSDPAAAYQQHGPWIAYPAEP